MGQDWDSEFLNEVRFLNIWMCANNLRDFGVFCHKLDGHVLAYLQTPIPTAIYAVFADKGNLAFTGNIDTKAIHRVFPVIIARIAWYRATFDDNSINNTSIETLIVKIQLSRKGVFQLIAGVE